MRKNRRNPTPLRERVESALAGGPLISRELAGRLGVPGWQLFNTINRLRVAGTVVARWGYLEGTVKRTLVWSLPDHVCDGSHI